MHLSSLLALASLALAVPAPVTKRAPVLQPRGGQIIPGKYIVKLQDDVADGTLDTVMSKLGSNRADHIYKGRFKGFASKIDAAVLDILRNIPEVSTRPQAWSPYSLVAGG